MTSHPWNPIAQKPVPVHATNESRPVERALGVLALLTLLSTVVLGIGRVGSPADFSYHIGAVFPERSWSAHRHLVVHLKYPALVLILALPMSRGDVVRSGRFRHLWTL